MSDTGRCWSFRKQNSWKMADYEALPSSAKFLGAPLSTVQSHYSRSQGSSNYREQYRKLMAVLDKISIFQ